MVMNNKKVPDYIKGRNHYQSISKKLKKLDKINDSFEVVLASLTLEEVLSLKLELSAEVVKGKFFGFPLMTNIDLIIKDSLVKFALSSTKSHKEAAGFLGISISELKRFIKKYNINHSLE